MGGPEQLEAQLCTDFNTGLTGEEADFEERRAAFGDNLKE